MSKFDAKTPQEKKDYKGTSTVADTEIRRSKRKLICRSTEKIGSVQVDNFPLLGKLTALRFEEGGLSMEISR